MHRNDVWTGTGAGGGRSPIHHPLATAKDNTGHNLS